MSHIVNIFGCKNCTVVIKGKVNAVTIGVFPPKVVAMKARNLMTLLYTQ